MPNSPRLDNTLLRVSTRLAQQYDIKLAPLLQECQLPPDVPDNPCRTVTLAQEQRFHGLLLSRFPAPGLGLRIGQGINPYEMGPFGLLAATSKTLGDVAVYNHWLTNISFPYLAYQQTVSEEVYYSRIFIHGVPASLRTFLVERFISTTFCPINRLVEGQHRPLRLELDYPDPGYGQLYDELFQCPVLFDQPVMQLVYPVQNRHLRLTSYDPRVHLAMRHLCQSLLQDLQADTSVRAQVKHQLLKHPLAEVNFGNIARSLNHSGRSLRRHLAAEQTSYQSILNEHRLALAKDKLSHTQTPVSQIAQHCGFSDTRNFIRAFQQWTGLRPSTFRKMQQER